MIQSLSISLQSYVVVYDDGHITDKFFNSRSLRSFKKSREYKKVISVQKGRSVKLQVRVIA